MLKVAVRSLALVALMWAVPACTAGESTLRSSSDGSDEDCTLTQGYWKNHEEAWPVDSLALGNVVYSKAALLAILHEPVSGNGLISLSHQLIAAKLNIAAGAPDTSIAGAIADADAMIGDRMCPPIGDGHLATSATSGLVGALGGFNEGDSGPGHCGDDEIPPACGDGMVDVGEECDDGNTTSGDGCSAACTIEVDVPACGDGTVDAGEECDDGNTTTGDGCSAECTIEHDDHACGDGTVDAGEECDDGNTTNGDGCSAECTDEPPKPCCGDGVLDAGEQCDDGNTTDGDGCSATCILEIETPPCVTAPLDDSTMVVRQTEL